jgi:hypothetical protein
MGGAMALLLSACAGTQVGALPAGQPSLWIDAPLDGSVHQVADGAITMVFSAASAPGEISIAGFSLLINGDAEADVTAEYQVSASASIYANGQYEWVPSAAGVYVIELRAIGAAEGTQSAFAEITVIDAQGAAPTPETAVTEAATPGAAMLVAVPQQNANCRVGPSGTYFDIVDTLFAGSEYKPIGRGADNLWVLFAGPAYAGECWVFIDSLDLLLDEDLVAIGELSETQLPFVDYPPIPTASPTATFTPEPVRQCSDGVDNDGDRFTDLADAECGGPNDNDELNP